MKNIHHTVQDGSEEIFKTLWVKIFRHFRKLPGELLWYYINTKQMQVETSQKFTSSISVPLLKMQQNKKTKIRVCLSLGAVKAPENVLKVSVSAWCGCGLFNLKK